MKTKTWLILVLVGAVVAGYAVIGSAYLKAREDRTSLDNQAAVAEQTYAGIPPAPTDLAERLQAAQDSLAAAESAFAADTNETHIINAILLTAKDAGVKAVPLNTSAWTTATVADRNYLVFRVSLDVSGTYAQVQAFVDKLETGQPATLVIESLAFSADAAVIDGSAGDAAVSAAMNLAVYAIPGAN